MKKSLLPLVSVVVALSVGLLPILTSAQDPTTPPKPIDFDKEIVPIVKASCIGCHNTDKPTANVVFPDKMTLEDAKKNPKLWRKVARAVKSEKMPPKDHGTMGDKDRKKLLDWITATFPRPTTPPANPPTTTGGGTTSGN